MLEDCAVLKNLWRNKVPKYYEYKVAVLNERELRKIQEFIKQNYLEMYLKWASYSEEGYFGK